MEKGTFFVLCFLCGCVVLNVGSCLFVPVRGSTSQVHYNATSQSMRFPDEANIEEEEYNYFLSEMNFDAIQGKIVVGAADKLYLLNPDLSLDTALNLSTSSSNLDTCRTDRSDNPGFACHNHIRVYRKIPGQDTLLVCGTHAGVEPRCLGIGVNENSLIVPSSDWVVASDGIISYYPEFSQFGAFRNDTDADSVYLSAGFFPGDSGAGRHFSISYNNITLDTQSDPSLETETLFQTINANNNWLRFPVVFVGAEKADYSSSFSPTQREGDYQFWFLFLKERQVTNDVIQSQLARVCRNDPGSSLTANGARYFSTFMKARIFCEKSTPANFESIHTLDYDYNSITSFVFSPEGRYYSNTMSPRKLLYASFTGPANGPVGSAICVYPADNSIENSGNGRTSSVFDIFREDLVNDVDSTLEENNFVECDPTGRPEDQQQLLFINPEKSVQQIGDDPILILENEVVTQMVQDTVCVVTRDSSSTCVHQDILFLGLDSGHVLKVVFATDSGGDDEPVVAEDIGLDDENPITGMTNEDESGLLYVTTWSRLYKLPLQTCSRFSSCSGCVGSRDPYCVWSDDSQECVLSSLTSAEGSSQGTVNDTRFFQNIHTGEAAGCNYPEVGFRNASVSVREGAITLSIEIFASKSGFIELNLESGTATEGDDFIGLSEVVEFGSMTVVTVMVTLIEDDVVEGDEWFLGHLRPVMNNGVIITMNSINITIIDDDNIEFYFSSMSYTANEGTSYVNLTINKTGTTTFISTVFLQSIDGSAIAGVDYLEQDLELTFEPLSNSMCVIIPLINDNEMEEDEEFALSLLLSQNTHGIDIGSPGIAAVAIHDDDEVTVGFSLPSYTFLEEDSSVTISLTKSGQTQLPVQVQLSTSPDTASAPADFTELNKVQLTFLPEVTSVEVTVNLIDDEVAEEEEFFLLTISTTTIGVRIDDTVTRVTIEDRDTVILRLASTVYTWNEGDGMVSVLVEKIGFNERVISSTLPAQPNSALEGLDYSMPNQSYIEFYSEDNQKEVTLVIVDDNELEETETFLLTLNNGPGAVHDNNSFANIVIIDNDEVKVEISAEECSLNVSESDGGVEIILVKRGLSAIPVEVMVYLMNGSAIESSDFSRHLTPTTVTISPTSSFTLPLMVSILNDDVVEGEEYFFLSLASSQSGVSTTDQSNVSISISDDDDVVVTLSVSSVTVSEESVDVLITIEITTGLHSIPVTVMMYTQPITAKEYLDYEPVTMEVIFEPGESEKAIPIILVNDDISEETETFLVSLVENESEAKIGMISQAIVNIQDFDSTEVGFSIESHFVSEGVGWVTVLIDISGQFEDSIDITISTESITATAGDDYQELNTELLLYGNSTSSTRVNVLLYNDVVREETEEFRVRLTLQPHSRIGLNLSLDSTIIQIEDDDSISIGWEENSYTVSESQGILRLNLVARGSTSSNYTLLISTTEGSTTGGEDYISLVQHQITAFTTTSSLVVDLTILNDVDVENMEDLRVIVETISEEKGVIISDPETTVYIISDDFLQVQFSTPTYTVTEGESAFLTISSTVATPFNFTIGARIDSATQNFLYLLQNVVTIPNGSMTSSIPVYAVPSQETRTDTQRIEIELQLLEGTASSVVLGANSKVEVIVLASDVCSSTSETSQPVIVKSTPTPSVVSPDKPFVDGNIRDSSEYECFYPNSRVAVGLTAVLAVMVFFLLGITILLLLCLIHVHKARNPRKSFEAQPETWEANEVMINPEFEPKEHLTSLMPGSLSSEFPTESKESRNDDKEKEVDDTCL